MPSEFLPQPAAATWVDAVPVKGSRTRVADEAEHPDETLRESDGIGRGMVPRRGARDIGPDLSEHGLEARFGQQAERARGTARPPVAAGLPLHQDEFDVVLDHGVGFVRLAQKAAGAALHLVRRVRDLVPDDRRQVVEPDRSAALLDGSMQRNHGVSATVLASGQAHVTDDADESPAGHQGPVAQAPDLIELIEKLVVVGDPAELAGRAVVLLESPVRRRGQHEVNRLGRQGSVAGVPQQTADDESAPARRRPGSSPSPTCPSRSAAGRAPGHRVA